MSDIEAGPQPINAHIGGRIRERRTLMGMSQERLGDALGLTFQQVQKYERGLNRVASSTLLEIARALDVPIGFFFSNLPEPLASVYSGQIGARRSLGFADGQESFGDDVYTRRDTLELVRAYNRIADPAVRKRMLDLIKSMGTDGTE